MKKIFLVILICLTTKISFADFETGLKAFNDGKYEKFSESIPLFLDLLQYDSKNYEIYNYLGDSYLKTNNLKLKSHHSSNN